ncbi:MAG: carbohydrate-binding domain-containing protein, partial [Clostridia bacterium]|nr:carbohydrate-binding domain-containing protein [Clostridia bacterium]
MKKSILKILTALTLTVLMVGLAACGIDPDDSGDPTQSASPSEQSSSAAEATPVTDSSITAQEATDEFSISTTDGAYTLEGSVYKITSAGTYVLRGLLEGGIAVDAGSSDEVIIELSGATISYSADSPIKILSADKVEISAKKGTENVINDGRSEKAAEESGQGEGAINSKVDLKLKGSGTLVINAAYNNGINCTKDVTIQKLSLKVLAVNTAIKGKDSVTVKSGTVVAISTGGDGVKTENTDLNKSGESRGDINIEGGSVTVYAAGDGFQAAHSFIMQQGEKSTPYVCIFTGSYSGYTAESASTTSYKGVKAEDKIQMITGTIEISSYDDGLHANYGTVFESGQVGSGAVEISGGA